MDKKKNLPETQVKGQMSGNLIHCCFDFDHSFLNICSKSPSFMEMQYLITVLPL